jgi:hypothetical protein
VEIALIIGAVLLGIVLISSLLASRRRRAGTVEEWDAGLREATGEARWVHEVLSLDIANRATTRTQDELLAIWQDGRRRITDLEASLYRASSSAPEQRLDVPVYLVTDALRGLREALDNDLNLRSPEGASAPGQDTLLDDSAALISQRRAMLLQAVQTIENPQAQR